jgi:hypothetical protein
MDFNANQMRADALIPEGQYKFRVKDAREKRSSAGNDMLNLKLILNINGREVSYWDSLILLPKMFWKIEHFCETTGLQEALANGRLMAGDCIDKEGWIDIVQKVDGQTGVLDNQTRDYVMAPVETEAKNDDFIPFDEDVPNFA